MNANILPAVNAALNSLASMFLILGFVAIKKKQVQAHRVLMISAFITSVVFLASYLTYHFSTHIISTFQGEGPVRIFYFAILISHSILAAVVPFLAIITLFRGIKMNVERHRKIARWTLPLWLYVSVTGVIVYVMLYHLYA